MWNLGSLRIRRYYLVHDPIIIYRKSQSCTRHLTLWQMLRICSHQYLRLQGFVRDFKLNHPMNLRRATSNLTANQSQAFS